MGANRNTKLFKKLPKITLNIMAIAIFGLPKNCNFCHFYIHTLVAIATCATKQEGKKKTFTTSYYDL